MSEQSEAPTPLTRVTAATLDVLLCLTNSQVPLWGLKISQSTNRPTGTVYPILDRLERQGWLVGTWELDLDRQGPRRRLYQISPSAMPFVAGLLSKPKSSRTPERSVSRLLPKFLD